MIKEVRKSYKTNSNERASIDSKQSETTFIEINCNRKYSHTIELANLKRKTSDYGKETEKQGTSQVGCLVLLNKKSDDKSPRTSIIPVKNDYLKINTEANTSELFHNLSRRRLSNNLRPSPRVMLQLDSFKRKHLETYLRKSSKSEMRKSQKSHYTVIMISNIWSVVASIPYSVFSYYLAVIYLHHGKDYIFELKITTFCQVVSSVLFNSNHSTNFFIYISFYKEFQDIFKNLFSKCTSKS